MMEPYPIERTEAMSFGAAIQTVFRKYAEFTGGAMRAEFWWWALFNILVANAYLGSLLSGVWGIAVLLPSPEAVMELAWRPIVRSGHA